MKDTLKYTGSLHNHTEYSNFRLRDCIIRAEELVLRAIELGHKVIAITDHETLANAVEIEELKNKYKDKIKVILGNEIYLVRNGLDEKNFKKGYDNFFHFVLLAKDLVGYQQLCELSTRAWIRSAVMSKMRRVPTYYEDLEEVVGNNKGHIVGSTACLGGTLPKLILMKRELLKKEEYEQAAEYDIDIKEWCIKMANIFGKDNFFLELQPSASNEQTYVNKELVKLSNKLNIPYIITTDSHYLRKEDAFIHEAFLKAQDGEREVSSFYATTYLMDNNELQEHLDLSEEELQLAYDNISKIADMCNVEYSIYKDLKIPNLKWKKTITKEVDEKWFELIPMFKTFCNSEYFGDKYLVLAVIDGINSHLDLQNQEAYDMINENLERTWTSSQKNKANWSAYYLNLQQIIELVWEADSIVGPGRGSGVGFLLLYALGITQINPLREETKTFSWRFLNPERVSVLDIDFDIEGSKRQKVLEKFREFYGEDRVANVTTLRREKTKSALLTAARGLRINNDEAQAIAALIKGDRGILRSLKECYYGDKEKGIEPIHSFVKAMEEYPLLWEVAQKIEGLICGTGIHAGGVVFVDEPFTNSTALMRAPDGTICTQLDLHSAEKVSLIKYDALSVEGMDKLHICLDLLKENKIISTDKSLKETYEEVIGVYNLNRDNKQMWDKVNNHEIYSLFQMEKQSGIQGIKLAQPKSVNDLCVLNSVIRLMAPDKNSETPLVMWSKYRKDINIWIEEMRQFGLTEDEIDWLSHHSAITDGVCESQEGLMQLVQEERLGGNDLNFADKCRKGIAKKVGKLFDECEEIFFENIKKKGCSEKLANYVWNVLLKVQRGYSFNRSHCLAYSLVALQEMNLATFYQSIFWNCACLICDSGSEEDGSDYAKIAVALGNLKSNNVEISLIDINESQMNFSPNIKDNKIYYGLKPVDKINNDVAKQIIENRPYKSIIDFMRKVKLTTPVMISLIKAGAFDKIDNDWASKICPQEPRIAIMAYYLLKKSKFKKTINLQNIKSLIAEKLLGDKLERQILSYTTNDQLMKFKKSNNLQTYFPFDDNWLEFFTSNYPDYINKLVVVQGYTCLPIKDWEIIFEEEKLKIKNYIIENQETIKDELNKRLFLNNWNKYASGNISKWEIDSLCFYFHQHELANVNRFKYGIDEFKDLSEEPIVTTYYRQSIPIYKLSKISGTVIAKNDNKSTVSLLTTSGVVPVKFTKEYYAMFKSQISEIQEDGVKKVIEKGWFTKGTKLVVNGYRRNNEFIAKTYKSKNAETHTLYKIDKIFDNGDIALEFERRN